MTDDGFYREDWFLESFLELADDLAAATATNKRLAIMRELRGCPYCRPDPSGQFRQAGDHELHQSSASKSSSSTSSARGR